MNPARHQALVASLARLPSLPAVVTEILASLGEDDFDLHAMAEDLARDQALAARVLRIANSPFYGLQGRIATLDGAAMVLGAQTLKALALAAAMMNAFPRLSTGGFSASAFWEHSFGTAQIARTLAGHAGVDPAGAFIGGLLHDLGRLVLISAFPQDYPKALADARRNGLTLVDAEQRGLGCDHQDAGALLADQWRFAPSIREAIAGHHLADDAPTGPHAAVIHLADFLAHGLEFGTQEGELAPAVSTAAWSRLGLSWEALREVLARAESLRPPALTSLAA